VSERSGFHDAQNTQHCSSVIGTHVWQWMFSPGKAFGVSAWLGSMYWAMRQ
jgi:hypothetical protein